MKKILAVIILMAAAFGAGSFAACCLSAGEKSDSNIINESEADVRTADSGTPVNRQTETSVQQNAESEDEGIKDQFPEFYRGIYLNVVSARDTGRLKKFIEEAKKASVNTFVMDCQTSKYKECVIPEENVQLCIENGIHPVARIVVFPAGLSTYPIEDSVIKEKLEIAASACEKGFHEIQFDYIRFNDSNKLKHLNQEKRYEFIGSFLSRARESLKKYGAKLAVDIFGRIPLNQNDMIGQKMERLDDAVDFICPMAYPSHYTWSKKMQQDPYYTVYLTSRKADDRTKNAEIVSYIQAFKMRLGSNSYEHYILEQVKAVHESGVRGYIFWNARQDYDVPFSVITEYYKKNPKGSTPKDADFYTETKKK